MNDGYAQAKRPTSALEESLALDLELGDEWNAAWAQLILAYVALLQDEADRAAPLFIHSLEQFWQSGDKPGTNYGLLGLAGAALSSDDPVRAARLFGAAETYGEINSLKLSPGHQIVYDHLVATLHNRLDLTSLAQAWAEGRLLTAKQAVDYALSQGSAPGPPVQ